MLPPGRARALHRLAQAAQAPARAAPRRPGRPVIAPALPALAVTPLANPRSNSASTSPAALVSSAHWVETLSAAPLSASVRPARRGINGSLPAVQPDGQAKKVADLTESNPTRLGLHYPPALLAGLSQPQGLVYEPEPLGLWPARPAVTRSS